MISLLYGLFLGAWRRWFGGGLQKLPDNRFLQHSIAFAVTFLMLHFNNCNIICNILACFVLQGLYWARSHGACFDYGHGKVDLKRYDQLWYWKYIKKIIPESEWYTYTGDFILMTVRYTLPAILCGLILWNIPVMFMGIVLSCVYALMWKFHDWHWLKNPTEWAEWIVGFTTGLFIGF